MTKEEAAIISVYTRTLIGSFSSMQNYMEELMGRPVYHHEMPRLWDELKEKSKQDFLDIKVE